MTMNRMTAAIAGLLLALPLAVAAEEETKAEVSVGGQVVSTDSTRDSKFTQYRDEPQGAIIETFELQIDGQGPWYLDLEARDLTQRDQSARLRVGKPGRMRFSADFNQISHDLYDSTTWLLNGSNGRYTLDSGLRQVLETAAIDPLAPTPLPGLMPGVLASTARSLDMRTDRKIGHVGAEFQLTDFWNLSLDASREAKSGLERISTGTYIRRQAIAGQPGTGAGFFDRERIEARGMELPEPIEYRVTDYGVGSLWHFGKGFVDASIYSSKFDNRIDQLYWENPFEAPASVSSSSTGLVIGALGAQEPSGFATTNNRGRSAQGALDLWPSNDLTRWALTGSYLLPAQTRITGTYSRATTKQDDAFLPYTVNEAIIYDIGSDGTANTSDDVLAKDLARPYSSLDGKIVTTRTEFRVNSHPISPLTLRALWRRYEYDNQSREMFLPGYAAAGESYFRRDIGRLLINDVAGYTRTNKEVGGAWRFGKVATLDLGYGQLTTDYEGRQVSSTDEKTLQASVRIAPVDWFDARVHWLDGSRDFDGTYDIGLETSRIRAYDVWNRDRSRYGIDLDFAPGDRWSVSLGWSHWNDKYPGEIPEPNPLPTSNPFPSFGYGLQESENESLTLNFAYSTERITIGGAIGHDTDLWQSLQVTKTTLASDGVQYDPENRWTRTQDDTNDWASLFIETSFTKKKARFSAEMLYNRYSGDLKTMNAGTPTINSAVAYEFPKLRERLLSGRLSLVWPLTSRMDLEARYLYEPYRLDDFAWDGLSPYMQGRLTETGATPTTLRPMNVNRLLWMDARYGDYTAQVASLLLHLRL